MNFFIKLINSFKYAAHGIAFCVRHETNLRIHIVAMIVVFFVAQFYELSRGEIILLILTCLIVICTEMINTAIEVVIDKVSPGYSALAKAGKDIAAGAVMISAIAAVIIAVIMFWDISRFVLIFKFLTQDIWHISMMLGSLCVFYLFIAKGKKRNIKGKKDK
ncbi:MAG: diacylglycerol kinase family protein [Eubacterium sp.]|nr:diacylglycerol kinase family protein [Eubacterium sp.]